VALIELELFSSLELSNCFFRKRSIAHKSINFSKLFHSFVDKQIERYLEQPIGASPHPRLPLNLFWWPMGKISISPMESYIAASNRVSFFISPFSFGPTLQAPSASPWPAQQKAKRLISDAVCVGFV